MLVSWNDHCAVAHVANIQSYQHYHNSRTVTMRNMASCEMRVVLHTHAISAYLNKGETSVVYRGDFSV